MRLLPWAVGWRPSQSAGGMARKVASGGVSLFADHSGLPVAYR